MISSLLVITGHSRTPWAGLEPVDGAARGQTSRDGGDLGGSAQSAVRVRRNGPAAAAGAWSEAEMVGVRGRMVDAWSLSAFHRPLSEVSILPVVLAPCVG